LYEVQAEGGSVQLEKSPDWLVTLFGSVVDDARVERRQMFGYPAGFARGQMCCGLFGSHLFVRLGEADRSELLRVDGAHLFDPMGGRPMREYVVLPTAELESESRLRSWIAKAIAYAESLPPKGNRSKQGDVDAPRPHTSRATVRSARPKRRPPSRS
jgi:TfoX/Sxy family transcriptional regulator of competence genes